MGSRNTGVARGRARSDDVGRIYLKCRGIAQFVVLAVNSSNRRDDKIKSWSSVQVDVTAESCGGKLALCTVINRL